MQAGISLPHLSFVDRLPQTALAAFYPWAARFANLTGSKSDAAAIAVWHAGRLLVVKQSYTGHLTLPGGHIESDEQPVEAAVRELEEEVGIAVLVTEVRLIGRMEQRRMRLSLFECQLTELPGLSIDNREITIACFADPSTVRNLSWVLRRCLRARR